MKITTREIKRIASLVVLLLVRLRHIVSLPLKLRFYCPANVSSNMQHLLIRVKTPASLPKNFLLK